MCGELSRTVSGWTWSGHHLEPQPGTTLDLGLMFRKGCVRQPHGVFHTYPLSGSSQIDVNPCENRHWHCRELIEKPMHR